MSQPVRSIEILVTGATGFLGTRVVEEALRRGHRVLALARSRRSLDAQPWIENASVRAIVADLVEEPTAMLQSLACRVTAIVHAASALGGDDQTHARDTLQATERLLDAAAAAEIRPRFVLASSLAVYDFASLPSGSMLDETTSLEGEGLRRDAYCRAKRGQEVLSVRAAQAHGVPVRCMRIGSLVGTGRVWTARLGWRFGPVVLCPGGRARVPIIPVASAARALVLAAEHPIDRSDLPRLEGMAPWDAINVVASHAPTQREYLRSSRQVLRTRLVVPLPISPMIRMARVLSLAVELVPGLIRVVPRIALSESFDARFKPLRFSNARLQDRLGWTDDPDH